MDTETLASFAMPARALTFNSIDCTNSLGGSGGPPDVENRRFSELIKRVHTNERRSPGGLRPKRPYGPFGSLFLITNCRVGLLSIVYRIGVNRDFLNIIARFLPLGRYKPFADVPANIQLLGTSFQKARRAFWGEARPGFGVHWCVYV